MPYEAAVDAAKDLRTLMKNSVVVHLLSTSLTSTHSFSELAVRGSSGRSTGLAYADDEFSDCPCSLNQPEWICDNR